MDTGLELELCMLSKEDTGLELELCMLSKEDTGLELELCMLSKEDTGLELELCMLSKEDTGLELEPRENDGTRGHTSARQKMGLLQVQGTCIMMQAQAPATPTSAPNTTLYYWC